MKPTFLPPRPSRLAALALLACAASASRAQMPSPLDAFTTIPSVPIYRPFMPPPPDLMPRASDCHFISGPNPFDAGGMRGRSADLMAPGASHGMSAADLAMLDYSLRPFDQADGAHSVQALEQLVRPAPRMTARGWSPVTREESSYWNPRCGWADRIEWLGRSDIALRDRTWHKATEAMARGDYPQALELLNQGYRKVGLPDFAYTAGVMLYNGQGVPRDPTRAIKLFDQVALARDTRQMVVRYNPAQPERANAAINAMLALADIYVAGKDVPADRRAARKLLERAVDAGYIPANVRLARLLTSGPEDGRDYPGAVRLLEEAAATGHAPAQYTLARLLEEGAGVAADPARALAWYQQAAFNPADRSRTPWAQYQLARLYDSGAGVARDPARALAFYRLAARSGHPDALAALANYLYHGELVDKDLVRARQLYRAAAERGSLEAMSSLAAILYRGEGGAADPQAAYAWLLVAGKGGHPGAEQAARAVAASLAPEQRERVEAALRQAPSTSTQQID